MSNPSQQAENRDALEHLIENGFSPLLSALERQTTYTSGGRVILAEIARLLGITPKRAGAMLRQAQSAPQIKSPFYLDPAAFTKLFLRRTKNHKQICLGLDLIAAGVSRRLWFASAHDKQDAIANALLFAIQRIDRFNARVGNDAFAYFSTVIFNCLRRQMQDFGKQYIRCVPMEDSHLDKLDTEKSYTRAI